MEEYSGKVGYKYIATNDVPIRNFDDNTAAVSFLCFTAIKGSPAQNHELWSALKAFTGVECQIGGHFEYTGLYAQPDWTIKGTGLPGSICYRASKNFFSFVTTRLSCDNFETGIIQEKVTLNNVGKLHARSGWGQQDFGFVYIDPMFKDVRFERKGKFDDKDLFVAGSKLASGRLTYEPAFDIPVQGPKWKGKPIKLNATVTDSIGDRRIGDTWNEIQVTPDWLIRRAQTHGLCLFDGKKAVVWPQAVTERVTGDFETVNIPVLLDKSFNGFPTVRSARNLEACKVSDNTG